MRSRLRSAVFAALVIIGTIDLPAVPAAADDPRSTPGRNDAVLAVGLPAMSGVDDVAQVIGSSGLEKYSAFYAGLQVDTPGNAVTVYATDRSAMRQVITVALADVSDEVRGAVTVTIADAPYSKKELWQARDSLWAAQDDW